MIWGSTWLAIKIGLESVPPFLGAAIRFLIATFILFGLVWIRKTPIPRDKIALRLYAVVGLCSFSIGYALVYWAQQYVPSGLASVLFATYPFFVAMLSWYATKHEQVTLTKVAGIILGFLGILTIFFEDVTNHWGEASTLGMLAIVTAALIQSFSAVTVKKFGTHLSPFSLNAIGMGIGTVLLFVISVITENWGDTIVDAKAVGSILYLSTLGSVVTFVTFFWLLKQMEAVLLSLSAFITPIVAMIIGVLLADEIFTRQILLGSSMVLLGILIANLKGLLIVIKKRYSRAEASV